MLYTGIAIVVALIGWSLWYRSERLWLDERRNRSMYDLATLLGADKLPVEVIDDAFIIGPDLVWQQWYDYWYKNGNRRYSAIVVVIRTEIPDDGDVWLISGIIGGFQNKYMPDWQEKHIPTFTIAYPPGLVRLRDKVAYLHKCVAAFPTIDAYKQELEKVLDEMAGSDDKTTQGAASFIRATTEQFLLSNQVDRRTITPEQLIAYYQQVGPTV